MSDEFVKFKFDVEPTDAALPLRVLLDNQVVWENIIDKKCNVEIAVLDDAENPSNHVFTLELHGKNSSHTIVDADSNIIADSSLKFSKFIADDIDISQLFIDRSLYRHNFNGNGPDTDDRFFDIMGCNGTVSFVFSTPFYFWLLENM